MNKATDKKLVGYAFDMVEMAIEMADKFVETQEIEPIEEYDRHAKKIFERHYGKQ